MTQNQLYEAALEGLVDGIELKVNEGYGAMLELADGAASQERFEENTALREQCENNTEDEDDYI